MSRHGRARSYAALIIAGLGWGLGFPFAKLALRELDAGSMILLRYAITSILVLPIVLQRAGLPIFTKSAVIASGLFYGMANLIQFEGVARTTVSTAALMVGMLPVLVALTARLLFHEKIRPIRWAGIALAAGGAALVTYGPDGSSLTGIALIFISLLVCLGWIFALRQIPAGTDPIAASFSVVVIGTVTIVPVVLARSGAPSLHLSTMAWIGILGQSVLATVVAIMAWQLGAVRVPAASAGVFLNIEPVVGALAGAIFFHEPVSGGVLVGGAAILAGSILVTRERGGVGP